MSSTNNDPLANWHSAISEIDDPKVLEAYQDAMEDVHTRFLLNLPPEELATADRILFQVEQAWWFYEDWICDQQQAQQQTTTSTTTTTFQLPRFKHLKPFAVEMFQFSPLLDTKQFFSMWETFSKYKRKISTYGCILLNTQCNKIILCQDYNSKSWTFPAGKINQGEEGMDAAARETWEETGFDPNGKYGLTQQIANPTWKQPLQEKDSVAYTEDNGKRRTYYICYGVPEDFPFEPVARKEVSMVQWHPLSNVPKKNFAVLPILPKIRRWIKRNVQQQNQNQHQNQQHQHKTPKKQRDRSKGRHGSPTKKSTGGGGGGGIVMNVSSVLPVPSSTVTTTTTTGNNNNNNRKTPNRDRKKQGSRPKSRGKVVQADDPLLETGLASVGSQNRWTEEDMFAANEKLLGRKVEYDGNPHVFSEQGFQGMDPHHFHIVGGNFLNSETNALAPPPPTSRLQHLFHTKGSSGGGADANSSDNNAAAANLQDAGGGGGVPTADDGEVLTPFFSDDGATPWGEVVEEVKESVASPERYMMLNKDKGSSSSSSNNNNNNNKKKQQGNNNNNKKGGGGGGGGAGARQPTSILATADNDSDLVFLTDKEITERSQKIKLAEWKAAANNNNASDRKYQQDMQDIQDWVKSLPQPGPTKHFGTFKFDVDALMEAYYHHY